MSYTPEQLRRKRELYHDNKENINRRRRARYNAKKIVPCRQCGKTTEKRRGLFWCESCKREAPSDLRWKLTPEEAERRLHEREKRWNERKKQRRKDSSRTNHAGAGDRESPETSGTPDTIRGEDQSN